MRATQLIQLAQDFLAAPDADAKARVMAKVPPELASLFRSNVLLLKNQEIFKQAIAKAKTKTRINKVKLPAKPGSFNKPWKPPISYCRQNYQQRDFGGLYQLVGASK